jgi:cytochrome c oxidase subunit 4
VADTETDTETTTEATGNEPEGVIAALEHPGREVEKLAEEHLPAGVTEPAPGLLPGEVLPHPSPFKYVAIAGLLVVLTALEVWMSYLESVSDNVIIVGLLVLMVLKFVMVAGWYMHLRTDKPIFRRFFILGAIAALSLYLIVLLTLHVFN